MKFLLALLLLLLPCSAAAKAIGVVAEGGTVITFYDEPCQLTGTVSNLPYRATWREGNRVFEGCAGAFGGGAVIGAYFADDKSFAVIPAHAVKPATEL